jgi:threonine/homoserine/homoserine lactone efflux protein
MLVLGGLFFVIGVASDMVWAIAAGTARKWLMRSLRRLAAVRLGGGVALILLGGYLGYYGLLA